MRALLLAALSASLLGGFWPRFGGDPEEAAFPLEAEGDIHFQADAVLFLEEGEPAVEVEIVTPSEALGQIEGSDSVHVRITLEMLGRAVASPLRYRTELVLPADTTDGSAGSFPVPTRWIRLHPKWIPGTTSLRVIVEDLTRYKRGLVDQIRKKHRMGEAAARIQLPTPGEVDSLRLSGILFAWGQAPKDRHMADGPGLRSVRSRLQPNPHRFYGLHQPVLSFYWERYPFETDRLTHGTPIWTKFRIVRVPEEVEVLETAELGQLETSPRWGLKRFDISQLAAGAYRLEVSLEDTLRQELLARSTGRFQVIWEEDAWVMDEAQMLTYARIILPSDQYNEFETLGRGDKAVFLRNFWNRYSPSAPGEPNELEQVFFSRVDYANRTFKAYRPGMVTDRGRVYIRYGAPDEISFNLNPQDRDLLWNILPGEIEEQADDAATRMRKTRKRTPFDNRAYEIWEYHLRGVPLLPEYVQPGTPTGLKFIFVDELGYGDFLMVYTNLVGGLQ